MNDRYIYRGEPEGQKTFGALPDGDYAFTVSSADAPYYKNQHWILAVKLSIQPQGVPVFANPWTGTTTAGEERDGIAEFLLAINRAPAAGEEPRWDRLVGARGKCRLKVEIAKMGTLAGKEVNKVHYFHRPKQVGPSTEPPRQSFTPEEYKKSQEAIAKTVAGPVGSDLDVEPDDIPF